MGKRHATMDKLFYHQLVWVDGPVIILLVYFCWSRHGLGLLISYKTKVKKDMDSDKSGSHIVVFKKSFKRCSEIPQDGLTSEIYFFTS